MPRTSVAQDPSVRLARAAVRRLPALLLLALPALAACAGRDTRGAADGAAAGKAAASPAQPATAAASTPAPAATEQPATSTPPPRPPLPEPPDGKWLTDERGQYFVREYPKKEGSYLRLSDGRVRLPGGLTVVLDHEDDKTFFYRYYRTPDWVPPDRRPPTPEALAAIEKTYIPEVSESVAVHLERLGAGLPTTGQWRNGFDLADMNGDGRLDIVHGPARKALGPPVIFLGDGQGGFQRWTGLRFPGLPYDYGDAAAGDLDGDGHQDMVLGVHLHGLIALVGDGKGGFRDWGKGLDFQVPGRNGDPGGFSTRSIALVDWNRDGRLDILALGEGPRLNLTGGHNPRPVAGGETAAYGPVLYLNQGNGTWVRKAGASTPVFGEGLAVADFDGDGRLDFATGSSATGRKDLVSLGQPDGSWKTVAVSSLRPNLVVRSVAAADFDGDRRAELAVGYAAVEMGVWRTGLDLLKLQADGTWTRRTLAAMPGRAAVTALGAGDLDSDGRQDLVALTGAGATWVFTGNGRGGFVRQTAAAPPDFPEGCAGYHVQLADIDGRPGEEILSSFAGEPSAAAAMDLPGAGRCSSEGGFQVWRAVPGTR